MKTKQNLLIIFIILVCNFILNLSINSEIAKQLTPSSYGDYAVFISIITIIGSFITLGLDASIDRYIPLFLFAKKYHAIKLYITQFIEVVFKNCVFLIILLVLYKLILFYGHAIYYFNEPISIIFYDYICFLLVSVIIGSSFFIVKMIRVKGYTITSILCVNILPFGLLYLFIMFTHPNSDVDFLILYTASWIISFLISLLLFYHLYQCIRFNHLISLKLFNFNHHDSLKDGYKLLLSNTTDFMFYFVIICLNIFSKNQNITGYAAAISSICAFFFLISRAVSTLGKPKIRLLYKIDFIKCKHYVHELFLMCIIAAVISFVSVVIFGKWLLLYFFGMQYTVVYYELCLAVFGFILVEGTITYKIFIEQISPNLASRIVILTNLLSFILILIGSYFSLFYAILGFTLSRLIYIIILWNYYHKIINLKLIKNNY